MTPAEKQTILARFFRPEEHETISGNVYVGIAPTIRRLNEVGEFNFLPFSDRCELTDKQTSKGKSIWKADFTGVLEIPGLGRRVGQGSDESFDPDTARKSAQAYALRKAANLFGVALYLWDAEGRKYAEDPTDVVNLKKLVMMTAKRNGFLGGNAEELADFLIVPIENLGDADGLTDVLRGEGVL